MKKKMAGFWRYSEIPLRFRGTCRCTEQRAAHYFGHEECMHMTRRVFVLPPKCMCLLYILRKFPCYTTADFYIWLFFSGACLYKARKSDRSASLLTTLQGVQVFVRLIFHQGLVKSFVPKLQVNLWWRREQYLGFLETLYVLCGRRCHILLLW